MTMRLVLAAMLMPLLFAIEAPAGTGYPMKCDSCGFEAEVLIGGGMQFEQITGYCTKSKEFVYLQWTRGEKKPKPLAKVWDPVSGKTISLYKCPDCKKPFIPLPEAEADISGPGFKCCPKCGKPTFKVDRTKGIMMFD